MHDILGLTALMCAAYRGDPLTARALRAAGADISATDWHGATALDVAVKRGDLSVVEVLLENGVKVAPVGPPRMRAEFGKVSRSMGFSGGFIRSWTPLMHAAGSGNVEIARLLLAKGADVNAKTKEGRTALSTAIQEGHAEVVALLKAVGAKE
jgi:ankyrin repeat protein